MNHLETRRGSKAGVQYVSSFRRPTRRSNAGRRPVFSLVPPANIVIIQFHSLTRSLYCQPDQGRQCSNSHRGQTSRSQVVNQSSRLPAAQHVTRLVSPTLLAPDRILTTLPGTHPIDSTARVRFHSTAGAGFVPGRRAELERGRQDTLARTEFYNPATWAAYKASSTDLSFEEYKRRRESASPPR